METEQRLSPHRIALRALIRAPSGGAFGALLVVIMLVVIDGGSVDEAPLIGAVFGAATAMFCGLLALAVEAGAYSRTNLRYVIPIVLSVFVLFVISAGGIWVVALSEGRGMAWAAEQFLEITKEIVGEPEILFGMTLALMLPFVGSSTMQLAMRAGRIPSSKMLEVGVVAVASLLGFFLICVMQESFPPDMAEVMILCVGAPSMAIFGMQMGGRLEARLLRAWRERQGAAD